jgi:hypothetical protein
MDSNNSNSISLDPSGYIRVTIQGEQTFLTYDELKNEVEKIVNKLNYEKKEIFGLVDLTNLETFNPSANKGAFQLLEAFPYKKVALYGCNPTITKVASLIIQAIGKADRTRIFSDEELALKWLQEK